MKQRMMHTRVTALTLAVLCAGVVGDDLADTGVVVAPAQYDQRHPALVCTGPNVLVFWTDDRPFGVYGAAVDTSGTLLGKVATPLVPLPGHRSDPAVALGHTCALVVWDDERGGWSDIYGVRVTPDGSILDSAGLLISGAALGQSHPSVAFDGINFLVVWQDGRNGSSVDIYGARVTPEGAVLDPDGIRITDNTASQREPAVSFVGESFLVSWTDARNGATDIYGARVTSDGAPLDTAGIPICTAAHHQLGVAAASGAGEHLVVWTDFRYGLISDLFGTRVSQDGAVLDPDGIPISTAPGHQGNPGVCFDSAHFLVVWQDMRTGVSDIYCSRVSADGEVLDPDGIPISAAPDDQQSPAVTAGRSESFVVWQDYRNYSGSDADVYWARVTSDGQVRDTLGLLVSRSAGYQQKPALGASRTQFLAAWEDGRNGQDADVYAVRIGVGGAVLDSTATPVSAAAYTQYEPAAASDGTSFLVVWTDRRDFPEFDIYACRLSPEGTALDSGGIPVAAGPGAVGSPAVGSDGASYLVLWGLSDPDTGGIYGARVDASGTVLDPDGFPVIQGPSWQGSPSVAFDGSNYLVVCADGRSGSDIYGTRVTPTGTVLDPEGIPICTSAVWAKQYPAVATAGGLSLVVWEELDEGELDIYGARVQADGSVLDPSGFPICDAERGQHSPAVAWDGTSFVVVWQDDRGDSSDLTGAKVSREGRVIDTLALPSRAGDQTSPALANSGDNTLLMVYQGWADTVRGKDYFADRVWVATGLVPGISDVSLGVVRSEPSLSTIVRGVLRLPVSPFAIYTSLFDMTGRQVMALLPGANDVRALAPGVYFVRAAGGERSAMKVRKVVLQR